jgi:hypothetical protein
MRLSLVLYGWLLFCGCYEYLFQPTAFLEDDWESAPYEFEPSASYSTSSSSSLAFSSPVTATSDTKNDFFTGIYEVADAWWTLNVRRHTEAKVTQYFLSMLNVPSQIQDPEGTTAVSAWASRMATNAVDRFLR